MMKFLIKPLSVSCAALALSAAVVAPAAHAELTAAAGVASAYYWRGIQVSSGAQVWGQLTYAIPSGFYGDLWASSEGFGVGPEYDLSAGWAGKFGDFGVNVGAVTYVYSKDATGTFSDTNGLGTYVLEDSDPGDFTDVYVKLAYGPVFFNAYHNVALLQGQDWINVGATFDKFTFAVGYQKFEDEAQLALGYPANEANGSDQVSKVDYTYAEITYAATKNLSITVSSIIDHDEELNFFGIAPVADSNRAKVIVAYSLPINF
jgi:uncharacterized protein (TIGR02001 family)